MLFLFYSQKALLNHLSRNLFIIVYPSVIFSPYFSASFSIKRCPVFALSPFLYITQGTASLLCVFVAMGVGWSGRTAIATGSFQSLTWTAKISVPCLQVNR